MKYQLDAKETRIYYKENSCIFKKNNDEFGGLSNMATIYPLKINGINIKTSEALYQACRFPNLPEIQRKIIEEKSPMTVKMISSGNKKRSRHDWDAVRLKVMKWCINVKLAQNFVSFGSLLNQTGLKNIVENSAKDNFWGSVPNEDETVFKGKNALGRLLMDLRQTYYSKDCYSLLYIEPPQVGDFLLYGEPISVVDERENFVKWLQNYWGLNLSKQLQENNNFRELEERQSNLIALTVEEETIPYEKQKTKRTTKKDKVKSKETAKPQTDLFNGLA